MLLYNNNPKSIIIDFMQTPTNIQIETDCVICFEIADEAMVTTCCTKLICETCCKAWQQKSKKFPYCTKQNFQVNPQNYIRRFCRDVSPDMQIFAKKLQGNTLLISLKQLDTVQMLFQRIYEREGIQIESLRISYNGKNVPNSKKSLRSIGLKNQSTIQILLRLKGGTTH